MTLNFDFKISAVYTLNVTLVKSDWKACRVLTVLVHPPERDEGGARGDHEESGEENAADELAVHDALLARVEDSAVLPPEGDVLDVARRSVVLHLQCVVEPPYLSVHREGPRAFGLQARLGVVAWSGADIQFPT